MKRTLGFDDHVLYPKPTSNNLLSKSPVIPSRFSAKADFNLPDLIQNNRTYSLDTPRRPPSVVRDEIRPYDKPVTQTTLGNTGFTGLMPVYMLSLWTECPISLDTTRHYNLPCGADLFSISSGGQSDADGDCYHTGGVYYRFGV